MRMTQASSPSTGSKLWLLVALWAFSVGGCATSRDALNSQLSQAGPQSVASTAIPNHCGDQSAVKPPLPVQTVGYDEQLAIPLPARLAFQSEGDEEAADAGVSDDDTTIVRETGKDSTVELAEPIPLGIASNVNVIQQPVDYFVTSALANVKNTC